MDANTLHQQLFSDPQLTVYAVIDGASLPELLARLEENEPEHTCLFRGELPFDLAETAPYLVKLEANSIFSKWLIEKSISIPCCIYTHSDKGFLVMRKHFRSLIDAELPDGEVVHFRYYDPRVLLVYLPTCTEEEKEIMYGEFIHGYLLMESDNDKIELLSFKKY